MGIPLANDLPLFLDGLRNLLTGRGIEVAGTARDGPEALEQARWLQSDLVLLDLQMPFLDGLSTLRRIKAELPEPRIVVLTMSAADEDLFEAVRSGACGCLLKTQDTEAFFSLLTEVGRGEAALSPVLVPKILVEFKNASQPA